jgi:tRNA (mo5U34)-methyltransferase
MPPHPAESVSDKQIRERIAAVAHWYHQIEIRPGITTPGINNSAHTLRQLDLAARYDGLRVLDIGARDGYFSFELERRGAEVVAVDYMDPAETGFPVARELLGSSVDFHVENIYDLSPERHGTFDLVLFLGLLYHLRDPLLALDRIWDVCNPGAVLMLETQLLDNAVLLANGSFRALSDIDPTLNDMCLMQFYPEDSLNGDHSNYWAPNSACTRGMLRAAGFAVTSEAVGGARGIFHARQTIDDTAIYHRRLEKTTVEQAGGGPAPARPEPEVQLVPDAAGVIDAEPMSESRFERELASARQHVNRSDTELAGAREYIRSLEAEIARKEAALVAALAQREAEPAVAPPPGADGLRSRVRRAADDLRGR